MDKKNYHNIKINTNSPQEEGEKMPAVVKKEQSKEGLSLSSKKLDQITVKPKVENGKVVLNKNNKDHRYLMEEEY